ncbi:TIGR03087 family PEP-CTERM/XrtA system glycosyltransferase [Qipengyuania sp. JC766]|uniref:TIGR03087 family PEP-CTERM/XrtA system glycosyltransferase n=1 Tax=Qipengyuania sp. JC766 TaxID=3232139 RepID=UPI0034580827
MGEILFLAHRIPFPPDRGDKIRSHHLLKALASLAPVHVGCFGETDADLAEEDALDGVSASHCLVRRAKSLPLAGLEAVMRGKPVSLTAFDHPRLRAWVADTLASRPIDTIFVFSGQMGQFVPDDFAGRVVIDLCDVDSAKFDAFGEGRMTPRAVIDRREGRLLAREEERLACRADTTLLITAEEAALFRSRLSDPAGLGIRPLPNGIDADFFDPARAVPHPDLERGGSHFVFTGQMDYAPNVDAVRWFANGVMPQLRRHHPGAVFHIVGRAPTAAVEALGQTPGVRVWGSVPDMRPFLAGADVVVAPLRIARGIQNKVLEAMAMARPVVLSPEAATGIQATDGRHFRIADGVDGFVDALNDIATDKTAANAMGKAARSFVLAEQSWPAMLAPLAQICGIEERGRDAA